MSAKLETKGKRKKKERADTLVLSRGLSASREKARALIMAGLVSCGGRRVEKPGEMIDPEAPLAVLKPIPYVGRGGLKLEEALEAFAVDCRGAVAADLGSSTGGFADCLLQRGARLVYAVDVSINQLDWRLRRDERVIPIEKNARYLTKEDFPETPGIVTMDVSFISVLKVLPAIRSFLGEGFLLSLLKPQFEAGKGQVGRKGILRDPAGHEAVLNRVLEEAGRLGFGARGLLRSSVRGQKGNQEFFVFWTLGRDAWPAEKARRLVREVVYGKKN
jgi:23S rRNA (cytidine1920-2'-O)/16S rRNA (cytidine1409-2'-O)-methyltransferase